MISSGRHTSPAGVCVQGGNAQPRVHTTIQVATYVIFQPAIHSYPVVLLFFEALACCARLRRSDW